MSVGERIKQKRIEKKLSLEKIGAYVGVSRQTIQKYENGTITSIPSNKIELIAEILETSPAYLMGWETHSSISELNKNIATRSSGYIKKKVAKNLKKFRESAKLQQKDVAEMLGVKSNTLSNWENEKNSIDIETLLVLCEIYKVTLDDMYGIQSNNSNNLTITKEPHLTAIKKYLNLNDEHQAGIRGMIDLYMTEEQQAAGIATAKGA